MILSTIAGVDEAGRGPLAGPVVAAAVIIPDNFPTSGIQDSKLLTAKQRSYYHALIKARCLAMAVAVIEPDEIDRLNIYHASYKAMRLAVESLSIIPKKVAVDGNRTIPGITIEQEALIKGDNYHPSIVCAGIVAKVTRDRLMFKLHQDYPQYGFRRHKGYCTASHLRALKEHGASPIHRRSFAPVRDVLGLRGFEGEAAPGAALKIGQ